MSFASCRYDESVESARLFAHEHRASCTSLTPSSKGDGLDLDGHALRQLLDGNARASRLVSKVLLVDRVHLGEVVHGGDEYVDLKIHV